MLMLLLRILLPRRIPMARRTNLFMLSRLTATAAESVSDLAIITAPGTMAVTAGTSEVIVGIMAETTADISVVMADTTVAMAGITESMEVDDLCGLVRLGKFNLPSLPVETYELAAR